MDSSGNVYGTTEAGGASGDGTVFEIATGSGTITTWHRSTAATARSRRALIMDKSGNLYGTAAEGGADGYGTVFEVGPERHHHRPGVVQRHQRDLPDPGLVMDSEATCTARRLKPRTPPATAPFSKSQTEAAPSRPWLGPQRKPTGLFPPAV